MYIYGVLWKRSFGGVEYWYCNKKNNGTNAKNPQKKTGIGGNAIANSIPEKDASNILWIIFIY